MTDLPRWIDLSDKERTMLTRLAQTHAVNEPEARMLAIEMFTAARAVMLMREKNDH